MKSKYAATHASLLKKIDDTIAGEKDVFTALASQASESAPAPATSGSAEPGAAVVQSRTLATPEFDGQPVPNFERVVDFEQKPLEDFNNTQALLGESNLK